MTGPGPRIAVALSGGGYRAAAFATGALLYLIDSGRAGQIAAVSSVSGGSVTNAYFARNVLRAGASHDDAWEAVAPLLAFLARRDILSPVRMLTFAMLLAVPSGFCVGLLSLAQNGNPRVSAGLALLVAAVVFIATGLALYLKLRRSLELAVEWLLRLPDISRIGPYRPRPVRAAARYLLATLSPRSPGGAAALAPHLTPFGKISASYLPIFSCTDLATGSQFHLSTSFVAGVAPSADGESRLLNLSGSAPTLPVATAVAASAAFPLVFRPAEISSATLGLPVRRGVVEERIALADGGLYDNFAVTVLHAWHRREMDAAVLGDLGAPAEAMMVVDSGDSGYFRPRRPTFLRTAMRSMEVIHQANNISRRQEIQRLVGSEPRSGTVVAIDDDPYQVAERCEDPGRRESALSWLEATSERHGLTRAGWRALAQQRNPGIRTNLRGLGTQRVADLVLHGYVATMARTTIDLGWNPSSPDRLPTEIMDVYRHAFVGSFWHRLAWVVSGGERRPAGGDGQ